MLLVAWLGGVADVAAAEGVPLAKPGAAGAAVGRSVDSDVSGGMLTTVVSLGDVDGADPSWVGSLSVAFVRLQLLMSSVVKSIAL